MTEFTGLEWSEIVCALDSKIGLIVDGMFNEEDEKYSTSNELKEWVKDLQKIIDKINTMPIYKQFVEKMMAGMKKKGI